ncbi:hypothetical protein D3C71_889450 [compost metagenome]
MIAAQMPICEAVGVMAIRSEQPAITDTDTVSARRRPKRSAKRPKYHAPIGRIKNVAAKMAHTYIVEFLSAAEKNCDSK